MRSTGLKMCVTFVALIILSLSLFIACNKNDGCPPGSLPDADSIQKADQSRVGQEVTVNIEQGNAFAFYKDKSTGQERMVVIKHNAEEALKMSIVPLTVYETTFGGIDAMVEQIRSTFMAKIVAVRNISLMEATHMTESIYGLASKLNDRADASPKGDATSNNEEAAVDVCYGVVTDDGDDDTIERALLTFAEDQSLILVGNHQDLSVEALEKSAEVFDVTYKRFDLKQYLPIN
ncbi:MAG TPA: hypothetical protein GX734_00035 [Clostridiaceae bacterium]|nr:hypothetical protein [Clostridiaceae bacterium]